MFAYAFNTRANITTFARGVTAAIIITAPVVIAYEFFFYASMNLISGKSLVVDMIANTSWNTIVGGCGWRAWHGTNEGRSELSDPFY